MRRKGKGGEEVEAPVFCSQTVAGNGNGNEM
jgi:hypothetical protein